MSILWIIPLVLWCVGFGWCIGQYQARKDYEPIIESVMSCNEIAIRLLAEGSNARG